MALASEVKIVDIGVDVREDKRLDERSLDR